MSILIGYIVLSYVVIIINALVRSKEIDEAGIPVDNIIWDIVLAPLMFPILVLGWIITLIVRIFK